MKVSNAIAKLPTATAKAVRGQLASGRAAKQELRERDKPMGVITRSLPTIGTGFALGVAESMWGEKIGGEKGIPTPIVGALVLTGLAIGAGSPMAAKGAVGCATVAAYQAGKSANIQLPNWGGSQG